MKKFSKKGVLLFVGAMAMFAFVLPGVSLAASWSPISSHHSLISPDIGFTSPTAGTLISSCSSSLFTVKVDSATILTITTGSASFCTTSAPAIGNHCLTTWTPTNFPWIATAVTTDNIRFQGVDIDVRFENFATGTTCDILGGIQTRLTGTITNGTWDVARREINFNNAAGLVSHPGPTAVAVRATFRSVGNGLLVLD